MRLILMGYRGCGKTTIGRALAGRLGWSFVDLDEEVCRYFGDRTIKQIWADYGEPAFRRLECFRLGKLLAGDRMVLALGGGTVMQDRCHRLIAKAPRSVRVYLYCRPEELHRRVLADPKFTDSRPHRPDARHGLQTIGRRLAGREPVYRALADHVVDVTDGPVEQAVEAIAALVQ